MHQAHESKISWLSEKIQIDPLNKSYIIDRSDAYALDGKYDQAISDYSKVILLQPSREFYVKRSKLLQQKGSFAMAIQDLADARTLKMDSAEVTAADIYLEASLCMENIKEASEMAHLVEENQEKADIKPYVKTLEELLHIQEMKIQNQQNQRNKEIQQLKLHYEEQAKSLKNFFIEQLNELKIKLNETVQNYEQKFLARLEKMGLSQQQKHKMKLYFQNFSCQAEKYYIVAKSLRKIQDKSLRFEDFEGIIVYKGRNEFMNKLYHFFDKYSAQIEKIVSIIQNIPYIGSTFNIIKAVMKGKGWVQQSNMQNQCINIEKTAINITSFNQLVTNLAYFATFRFQSNILASPPKYRSQWQKLLDRIKTIKKDHLGVGKYKQDTTEQMESVKDYAIIHASILMVGIACNCIKITKDMLKQANQAEDDNIGKIPHLHYIFRLIQQTQAMLKKVQDTEETPLPKNEKGYCEIC